LATADPPEAGQATPRLGNRTRKSSIGFFAEEAVATVRNVLDSIEADLTHEAQTASAVQRVLDDHGRIDMLINAAGVGVAAPFQNTIPSEFRQMVDIDILELLLAPRRASRNEATRWRPHRHRLARNRSLHSPVDGQLTIVISLLPMAAIGEIVGFRRVFQVGIIVFTLGSLGCTFTDSLPY
jgi:NAD(P)-dependent dehydrogenase (short-subunit alcohol dehydrogenase family)